MVAIIQSVLRHALTAAAGYLVAKGYIDEAGSQELIGALLGLVGVAWGAFDKVRR